MKVTQKLKAACALAKADGFKFMTVRRAPTAEGRDFKFIPLTYVINCTKAKINIIPRDKSQRSRPWRKAPIRRKTLPYQEILKIYG